MDGAKVYRQSVNAQSKKLHDKMHNNLDLHYNDEYLLVVNKPTGVLSQPGKTVDGSMATRVRDAFPQATGPMLVHRLDMDTSGLMVFAKTREVHKALQQQFEHRKITKRYSAVLSDTPIGLGGRVLLPLRLDIDNRPVQVVCFKHGKLASTLWRCVPDEAMGGSLGTRVVFTPFTGRTHQLRVHAAHPLGLNSPIIGDRLYGKEAERLMLHADYLGFTHPVTGKSVQITCGAPF